MAIKDDYAANTSTKGKLAIPTNSSASLVGNIETQGDHDWIKVSLVAGKAYSFTVKPLGASLLNDANLSLHNASGKLLSTTLSDYIPKVSDDYFVDVSSRSENKIGNYALTFANANDDFTNNFSTMGRIINGYAKGVADFSGDSDWFKIDLVAGTRYAFVTPVYTPEEPPTVDTMLRNSTGTPVNETVASHSIQGENIYEDYHTFTPTKSGSYYLEIRDIMQNDNYPSDYSIPFYRVIDDYGDTIATAHLRSAPALNHPTTIKGQTEFSSDADWFSLTLQANVGYQFELTNSNIETYHNFSVFDAKGNVIAKPADNDILFDTPHNYILFSTHYTTKYYLQIWDAYLQDGIAMKNDYTIKITQLLTLNGTQHNDLVKGSSRGEMLNGRAGNDTLNGYAGNDILNGGTGYDLLTGGQGSDSYYVDNTRDRMVEAALADEIDTVYSTVNYSLPANVENIVLSGVATLAIGNTLNNRMISNIATDTTLSGGNGDDYLGIELNGRRMNENWGKGKDLLNGGTGNDSLYGGGNNDRLNGDAGDDDLYGGSGNDALNGGMGNDRLFGGAGTNTLSGGLGKDQYSLDTYSIGKDTVHIHQGESLTSNFDTVNNFGKGDRLDLDSNKIAANTASANGNDISILHSHHINQGIISFDKLDTYATPLKITESQVADVIKYLQANITQQGDTVAFIAGNDTYVFQDGGTADTLVKLVGVIAEGIHNTAVANSIYLV